jgi:hypothetical protein
VEDNDSRGKKQENLKGRSGVPPAQEAPDDGPAKNV